MKDDAIVEEHVRLHQIKHEPTKGFYKPPYLCVRIWVSNISLLIQLALTTNDFQLHPPKEADTETPEQKEANRWAKKLSAGKRFFWQIVLHVTSQTVLENLGYIHHSPVPIG